MRIYRIWLYRMWLYDRVYRNSSSSRRLSYCWIYYASYNFAITIFYSYWILPQRIHLIRPFGINRNNNWNWVNNIWINWIWLRNNRRNYRWRSWIIVRQQATQQACQSQKTKQSWPPWARTAILFLLLSTIDDNRLLLLLLLTSIYNNNFCFLWFRRWGINWPINILLYNDWFLYYLRRTWWRWTHHHWGWWRHAYSLWRWLINLRRGLISLRWWLIDLWRWGKCLTIRIVSVIASDIAH